MKFEKGKKYECVEANSKFFQNGNIYTCPHYGYLCDKFGSSIIPTKSKFKLHEPKHPLDNCVILSHGGEHGKRVIEFWKSQGVDARGSNGNISGAYYGLKNGNLICAYEHYVRAYNLRVITLPEEPKRGDIMLADSDVIELRNIRDYFGEHYANGFEHMAFSILDGIVKRAEPRPLEVTKEEAEKMLSEVKGVNVKIVG